MIALRGRYGLVVASPGDGEACKYCERKLVTGDPGTHPTKDHFDPKSKSGTETVWCCRKCNHVKADMTRVEWNQFMADYPGWWRPAPPRADMLAARKRILNQKREDRERSKQ